MLQSNTKIYHSKLDSFIALLRRASQEVELVSPLLEGAYSNIVFVIQFTVLPFVDIAQLLTTKSSAASKIKKTMQYENRINTVCSEIFQNDGCVIFNS